MCGIGGAISNEAASGLEYVRSLKDFLRHRGPDDSGVWASDDSRATEPSVSLCHTRLSILDLSSAGRQPMESSDGRFVIVYNGEIYNYRELRETLENQELNFRTTSDTEVVLELLATGGVDALRNACGMFALGVYDRDRNELSLLRDGFGIKPLYLDTKPPTKGLVWAFSSELKCFKDDSRGVDPLAARDYLMWGSVPEPLSIIRDVRNVPSGHVCRLAGSDSPGDSISESRVVPPPLIAEANRRNDFVSAARDALEASVARHLVSDVPVGVFLSGGIDSTAILALARKALGDEASIRTFSIGFEDGVLDESSLARRTAEHFGSEHTEWHMTREDGISEIVPYLSAMDQPTIDGFNTWCVSKLAREHGMKVVLSGLGGDEIFAGYKSFYQVGWFRRFKAVCGPFGRSIASCLDRLPAGSRWRRLAAYLRNSAGWLGAYHVQRGVFTEDEANSIVGHLLGHNVDPADWADDIEHMPTGSPREIVSYFELTRYMRNQLLRDSDVFSMAHGLELRVPFVDAQLLTSLSQIPSRVRLKQGKKLLLDAVPEIPDWIRGQPKRGFVFPFQKWMEGSFGDLLRRAEESSPVPLRTWYRRWAVAALLHTMVRGATQE